MSRGVRDPDYRRRPTRAEVAARALFLMEHPHVDAGTWDLIDAPSRAWWVERARPIVDALEGANDAH